MDIDSSRVERLVTEKSLYGQKVDAVFIEMSAESMTEGMAGKAMRPSKTFFMVMDMTRDIERIHRTLFLHYLGEEPVHRSAAFTPVLSKDIESILGKDSKSVGTVLGMRYIDAHILPADILIFKITYFTDSET